MSTRAACELWTASCELRTLGCESTRRYRVWTLQARMASLAGGASITMNTNDELTRQAYAFFVCLRSGLHILGGGRRREAEVEVSGVMGRSQCAMRPWVSSRYSVYSVQAEVEVRSKSTWSSFRSMTRTGSG